MDLKQLFPGLSDKDYKIWGDIIKNILEIAGRGETTTIIETCNNKLCGFMNFAKSTRKYHLNYIATVPIVSKEKVPFAGQILFNEFFRHVLDSCIDVVELKALRESPFSPISKYLKLGFKPRGGNDYTETMRIYRNDIIETMNKQAEHISYTEEPDKTPVSLSGFPIKKISFYRKLISNLFKRN